MSSQEDILRLRVPAWYEVLFLHVGQPLLGLCTISFTFYHLLWELPLLYPGN